jgi:hypothetical protein
MDPLKEIDELINHVARSFSISKSEYFRNLLVEYLQQLYQHKNKISQLDQPKSETSEVSSGQEGDEPPFLDKDYKPDSN